MGQIDIYKTLKNMNSVPQLENFKIISILGKGGFSQVKKVKYYNPFIIYRENNKDYFLSMKEMPKNRIIQYNCFDNIFQERDILLNLYNNNIVNMYCTFQDKNNIYMIMDYMPGKDLRNLMKNNLNRRFKEKEIIFFAACIISGLEYIHSNGIIHRDIKPENLLFDSKYFLRIADFGIAIKKDYKFKNDNIGTFNYIAPERIGYFQNENSYKYSFESDFYSLGIVLYELCLGKRPFDTCKGKEDLLENFCKIKNIRINSEYYSENLLDLINKLLIFDPCKRIGYNNVEEIKSHPVFYNFPWKNLIYKTMKSPILEENNDIILKTRENILINEDEENKDDSIVINEKDQKKFKDYSCIHKLNISDIMKPKNLVHSNLNINHARNNSIKISSTTIKNNNPPKIFKDIKSFNSKKFQSEKKISISNNINNNNKNGLLVDKKIILKKNLFRNNNNFLPKIGGKLSKNISETNLKIHYKLAENIKSNIMLNEISYNHKSNKNLNCFGNKIIKSPKGKLINTPFLKRASAKLKNILNFEI